MANLYLIDKPFGGNGLQIAAEDRDAVFALIQDGVFLASAVSGLDRPVYAIERDVERRGLQGRLPACVKAIGFDGLVDLIVANKVINFA